MVTKAHTYLNQPTFNLLFVSIVSGTQLYNKSNNQKGKHCMNKNTSRSKTGKTDISSLLYKRHFQKVLINFHYKLMNTLEMSFEKLKRIIDFTSFTTIGIVIHTMFSLLVFLFIIRITCVCTTMAY